MLIALSALSSLSFGAQCSALSNRSQPRYWELTQASSRFYKSCLYSDGDIRPPCIISMSRLVCATVGTLVQASRTTQDSNSIIRRGSFLGVQRMRLEGVRLMKTLTIISFLSSLCFFETSVSVRSQSSGNNILHDKCASDR